MIFLITLKTKMKNSEALIKIALAILLFLCLLDMPYGYYQFVRFVALIGFGILTYKAIEEIDKSIARMEKVKQELRTTGNQLRLANQKADGLTIKKLTYGNPTMKAKFDGARKNIE